MNTMPCQTCGSPIDLSGVKTPDREVRMYCSRSCATRMNNVLFPKRNSYVVIRYAVPEKDADGTYNTCMVCQEDRVTKHNSLFCSPGCRTTFWDTYQDKKSSLHSKATVRARAARQARKKKCPHCETMIQPTSKACNTHRWTEGTPGDEVKTIDNWVAGKWSGQYGPKTPHVISDIVRNYLYDQCGFSCTKCGFNEKHPADNRPILQINHIDGDATNHSPGNLEVLCPNCHAMTPNYGRRNQTSTRPRTTK